MTRSHVWAYDSDVKAKVTLTIDPALWRQFRSVAIARGGNASAEVEKLMRAQLDKWAKEKR